MGDSGDSDSGPRTKYGELGVDARKRGIEVFTSTITNAVPGAFCVLVEDGPDHYKTKHSDGAGSKPVQSYLHWMETGDPTVVEGLAQDTVMMNLGDIECVGGGADPKEPIEFTDTVDINGFNVPKKEFLAALNRGFARTFSLLRDYGIHVQFMGGETADLPDQQRTVNVSGDVRCRIKRSDVITADNIRPRDIIMGLRSGGKANYEGRLNSGIMCNGITLARHCLMLPEYEEKYPEIREPKGKEYYGKFRTDEHHPDLGMMVGEAITSPTRIFSPVVQAVLKEYRDRVRAITLNSGGGQTKILRLGRNVRYVKDKLPDPDPIFYLIQEASGEEWKPMHEDFNMGIGMDIVCDPSVERGIRDIAHSYGVGCRRTGYVEALSKEGPNEMVISGRFGPFHYKAEEAA